MPMLAMRVVPPESSGQGLRGAMPAAGLQSYPPEMYIPPELSDRVQAVGHRVGCKLTIVRCWQSEGGRPAMYCNVRGTLHESPELLIEIAGTVCAEMAPGIMDEINLFLFVNGRRVGLHDQAFKYLIGYGDSPLAWDYNDEGFDQFVTLDESTYSQPIDEALVIRLENDDSRNTGG